MVTFSHSSTSVHARPPTPPKENIKDSAKLHIDNSHQGTICHQFLLDTPEESPSSSTEYFNGSGTKLPKRVVFSPWTSYHKPLDRSGKAILLGEDLRPLPPSKQCTLSHKSILKPSANNSSPLFEASQQLVLDPNESVAAMLRSVNQHLNSASRDSRVDSYRTLQGCLTAYEEVPDPQSLIENLTGFLEYIRRDLVAKQPGCDSADVELATSALKVLAMILYTPGLTDAVPYDFGIFIAEQAISSIENQNTPKAMLDHYMSLLARQKLPPKVINSEKANRLLNALNGLEARVKGNRVVGLKLMIYQRMTVQVKNLMVPRAEDWLEFLISSMSSSIKDIRSRAIAFGVDAALALGTSTTVLQNCLDILDRDTPSGIKVVDYLGARMLELLNTESDGTHVPQIWSIIILFLRSRRRQIERWEHMRSWLGIMQRAFNSSDSKIKFQANVAWNRLIYAVNPDTSTSASFIRTLRQPIASQLERKNNDTQSRHAKQLARSTYCNLLYYSFRPGATHEQLDLYWDAYVSPILLIRPSMTKSDTDFSCEVLGALLSSSQSKVWDENRAHQLSPIKPEELPCLDPKWIRFRAAKVVSLLEGLLLHGNLSRAEDVQETPLCKAWQSFVKAVGNAASKEVKVSMETMVALAHIVSSLCRYWNQGLNGSQGCPQGLDLIMILVKEAVAKMGCRPFGEKRLLRSSGDSFEATETPSSRTGRPRGSPNSPIAHILATVVNSIDLSEPSDPYAEAVQTFVTIALRNTNSRRAQLALLWELGHDILSGCSGNITCRLILWDCLAKAAAQALSSFPAEKQTDGSPQCPGNDFREAAKLLELGIQEFPSNIYSGLQTLSDVVLDRIQDEICLEGISLVYSEPLSKSMRQQGRDPVSDDFLRCSIYLVNHTRWPESRQGLERARRLLWGPGSIPRGPAPHDPFEHLYSLITDMLTMTYSSFSAYSIGVVVDFISTIKSFLTSCPLSLKAICLKRIQRGIAWWIEDSNATLSTSDTSQELSILVTTVKELWTVLIDMIKSIPKPDSLLLAAIQDLLIAGFRSRHRAILNDLILMWNQTFAEVVSLEYPTALRDVLLHLRSKVDFRLPGLAEDTETEIMSSPFNFIDSQAKEVEKLTNVAPYEIIRSPGQGHAGPRITQARGHQPVDKTRSACGRYSRREPRSTPKGRLRHDDSQIQFAAIDSSPPTGTIVESQHLTDHQKEVKERQEEGAAVTFPDIRSSPRRSRSAERLPELVLHRKQASSRPLDADAEPSPTFPPGDMTMNEFLGSSPTPQSSRKASAEHQVNDNQTSSPLSVPQSKPLPGKLGDPHVTASIEGAVENVEDSNVLDGNPLSDHILSDTRLLSSNSRGARPAPADGISINIEQRATEVPTSDSEDFVDAPVHPTVHEAAATKADSDIAMKAARDVNLSTEVVHEQPVTPQARKYHRPECTVITCPGSNSVVNVGHSTPYRAPITPTEDEQAREQLLRDLEEASSQGDSQVSRRRPSLSSPSEASRKRKLNLTGKTKPRKTAKRQGSFVSCEIVVENRKPDPNNDDCIIIDDRPAAGAGEGKPTSPIIKQERSSSPMRNHQPSGLKTSASIKHSLRRRTRSMTSRGSSQPPVIEDPLTPSARSNPIKGRSDTQEAHMTEEHPKKRRRIEQQEEADDVIQNDQSDIEISKEATNRDDGVDLPTCMPSVEGPTDSASAEEEISSSQIEHLKGLLLEKHNPTPETGDVGGSGPLLSSNDDDTEHNTPDDEKQQDQNSGAASGEARSPGQRMLERFKQLLDDVKKATFWREEETKEMVEVAFEVVRNMHGAERKNNRRME